MNLLIFLTHPEPTRSGYEKYLSPRHPELTIKTFGTRDEAIKHAAWADIMMCFGPQVKTDFFKETPKLKWVHSLGTGTDGITDCSVSRQGRRRHRDARHPRRADVGDGVPDDARLQP